MLRKNSLVLFFKILVFIGVVGQGLYLFVYKQNLVGGVLSLVNKEMNFKFLFCASILMFFNWSFEALKWKLVIKWVKKITFFKSLKVVLLGLAFSFFTPRGIGEYFARAYTIEVESKLPVVLSLLVSRMTQLFILILGGLSSYFFLKSEGISIFKFFLGDINVDKVLFGVLGSVFVIGFIIYLYYKYKIKVINVVQLLIKSDLLTKKTLVKISILSLIRYLTYCVQFVLLVLTFVSKDVTFLSLLAVVMFTFFMKALVPVFNFMSDLGVREVFSVIFLSYVGIPTEVALTASLSLWLLNIVIPTCVGTLLVFKAKVIW